MEKNCKSTRFISWELRKKPRSGLDKRDKHRNQKKVLDILAKGAYTIRMADKAGARMDEKDGIRCPGCDEVKSLEEFYKHPSGKPFLRCKICTLNYQRNWRAEKKKERVITPENKVFFELGATAKDDQIRDLQKALNIQEKANRALVRVIREADLRDFKRGRRSA